MKELFIDRSKEKNALLVNERAIHLPMKGISNHNGK
jgi:hypothetical protein